MPDDNTQPAFPPFVPAKSKGGGAPGTTGSSTGGVLTRAEIIAEAMPKVRRKRRTAAEMAAANGQPTVDTFLVYREIVKMLEAVSSGTRFEIIQMLADHHT